jgi:hypothetical protein
LRRTGRRHTLYAHPGDFLLLATDAERVGDSFARGRVDAVVEPAPLGNGVKRQLPGLWRDGATEISLGLGADVGGQGHSGALSLAIAASRR